VSESSISSSRASSTEYASEHAFDGTFGSRRHSSIGRPKSRSTKGTSSGWEIT
jgi:hypothetical protein